MQRRISTKQALGVILLVALILRLLVFAYIAHETRKFYTYDSDGYDQRAQNLLEYGVFASEKQPPFTPDLDRTPVYPVFLAGVFAATNRTQAIAVLIQIAIGCGTVVLTYGLTRNLGLPKVAALAAAALVALDPVTLMTTNRLLTETIFTFLLVSTIYSLVRYWNDNNWRWLILASVLLGLTSLTRPISQFLPIALLPLFALATKQKRLRAVLTAGLAFVVISTALTYTWAYRNYAETGVFTLSTISDTNLIYYRARAVLADVEHTSQDAAWAKIQERIDHTVAEQHLTPDEKSALEKQEAVKIFAAHPVKTFSMFAKGIGRIFVDPGYTISCTLLDRNSTAFDCFPGKSTMNEPGLLGKAFGKLGQMTWVQQYALAQSVVVLAVLYGGSLLGLVRLVRERRWFPLALLLIVIGYFVLLAAGAESNSRFRIPVVPFMSVFAGVGIQWVYAWYQARQLVQPRASRAEPTHA